MKWETVQISEFCKTGTGGTPSRSNMERYYEGGTIPWVKSGELRENTITETGEHVTEAALQETSIRLVPAGALLLALYGATVGRLGILGVEATTNQAVCHIIPDPKKANVRYLFRALSNQVSNLVARGVGGAQPNISQGIVKELGLMLPPLAEQKRIAAILDAADALRAKRREALAQLDALLQSSFLTLFGDPVSNPLGWSIKKSGEVFAEKPKIGTTTPANGNGVVVVRVGEIGSTQINFGKCGRVELNQSEFERYRLINGDTVIARAIGSKEQLGKASYFTEHEEPVVIDSHVMRLRPDPNICDPRWFHSLISSPRGKTLLQQKGGATAVQFNINATQAIDLDIALPPLSLQQKFAAIVESIERQKATQRIHLAELDALFAALQHRAFRGEL